MSPEYRPQSNSSISRLKQMPVALLQQLSEGGRLVIPVGAQEQVLRVYQRSGDDFSCRDIEAVRFVPLVPGELA